MVQEDQNLQNQPGLISQPTPLQNPTLPPENKPSLPSNTQPRVVLSANSLHIADNANPHKNFRKKILYGVGGLLLLAVLVVWVVNIPSASKPIKKSVESSAAASSSSSQSHNNSAQTNNDEGSTSTPTSENTQPDENPLSVSPQLNSAANYCVNSPLTC